MTTKPLSLTTGQTWRTVKGRLIEIISLDLTGGDFPLRGEFIAGADGFAKINWQGLTVCGDQLSEQIHIDAEPKPVDLYLERCIDDEMTLASLLGWKNFTRPRIITPHGSMFGTHAGAHGHTTRNGSVPMPAWRRDWHSAGQLVGRCNLHISPSEGGVAVHSELSPACRAIYEEHPSKDYAIFYAMCKAAIAHLRAEGELKNRPT